MSADVNLLETLLPGSAASAISDTVNQGLLKGMELSDKLEKEFCTPAYLQKGVKYPTECEVGIADQPTLAPQLCQGADCTSLQTVCFVHYTWCRQHWTHCYFTKALTSP